ncbi:autotransporter assembly complex protein TamA [Thalassospira marina]|uniref:Outer membrane protein assembly factor n=1 Tax=Thalassospira marina TaxID=2048283 RepID=A0ABM6Q9D1_9PROT|nr:autotransporter assembly complex family protein [Thalassospira marina]AUG53143.1 outer membrane protein assembly factor [Thalassospira marina]
MVLSVCVGASVLSACSFTDNLPFGDGANSAATQDVRRAIPYSVTFQGLDPQEERLLAALRENSTAIRLKDRPTPTKAGLERRAEDDVTRFVRVLRSFGFYDAVVNYDIRDADTPPAEGETELSPEGDAISAKTASNGDNAKTDGDGPETPAKPADEKNQDEQAPDSPALESKAPPKPVVLQYRVDMGTPYLLSDAELTVIHPDESSETRSMSDEELKTAKLSIGMRAEADPIILAEQSVLDVFRNQGYPLVKAGKKHVLADTAEKTIRVTYEVITGKKATFGKINIVGAEDVDADFIRGYHSWDTGEVYSPQKVTETRRDLAESNLFNSVIVKPVGQVDDNGEIPIEMRVQERDHRSIGGGLDFSTADGPGANAFWEHRNLFGEGEKLRLKLEGSGLKQGASASFRKPQFLRRKQALVAESEATSYTTDAYEGELANAFTGIEREFWENWSATYGVTLEYSDLTGADSPNEEFYLGGLRGVLRHDNTDNPLDPTTGNRMELTISPYMSLAGAQTQFTSVSLDGSQYYAFDDKGYYVLAGRGRIGSIFGDERSSLPSNKRFYSGGGGSVRGYEYQTVGPLNEDGDPVGGRSVIEAGLELRARITDSIGLVPFVEGGNVYEAVKPKDFTLMWATGLGVRYYTAIGPVRFDFAVPMDKRENIDDDYQIYLSLGQAF